MRIKESWRDIDGYAGYYQVSNLGRVRSLNRIVPHAVNGMRRVPGKVLRPVRSNRDGYHVVHLRKDGVSWSVRVHRLVLTAWVGPCPDGCECLHGPNGRDDNSVSNLRWGSHAENMSDKCRDGTDKQNGDMFTKPVRRGDGREFSSVTKAAKSTGCSAYGICKCCNGIQYRSGLYSWEFI